MHEFGHYVMWYAQGKKWLTPLEASFANPALQDVPNTDAISVPRMVEVGLSKVNSAGMITRSIGTQFETSGSTSRRCSAQRSPVTSVPQRSVT
jgi:hypothetical protein